VRPAADLLRDNRKSLVDKLTYWTGVPRPLVKKLVESMEARVEELGLRADVKQEQEDNDEQRHGQASESGSLYHPPPEYISRLRLQSNVIVPEVSPEEASSTRRKKLLTEHRE